MDRLQQDQRLRVNEELVSNNGWFRLVQQSDGNLVLYRTMMGWPLWASNTAGTPVNITVMQGDGNLVAYAPGGRPYFASGTDGHPGAWAWMQDDGNFVVYDRNTRPLWASNTLPDLRSPTIRYTEASGFSFNETSESWKELCRPLPCFLALQWPGYQTTIREDKINGQDVVIQLWKGWCPKFLGIVGVNIFPGGVGAEVGVYRRIPGHVRPTGLPIVAPQLATPIMNALAAFADRDLWWPFPELGTTIEMWMTNPITGQRFLAAGPQRGYWLTKWMDDPSYGRYQAAQGLRWPWLPSWWPGNSFRTPAVDGYRLEYRINGNQYPAW